MRNLEFQLEEMYPQFRRIWIQYSNKGRYRILLTLFPQNGQYEMAVGEASAVTFETVNKILQDYLQRQN
jgi:hypothetical protein